jgi:hypothetical protein
LHKLQARNVPSGQYSATAFRNVLREIRRLTAHGDANKIVEMCATAGVIVVFVPEISGCRISGAAWWAGLSRAIIALSDHYKKMTASGSHFFMRRRTFSSTRRRRPSSTMAVKTTC